MTNKTKEDRRISRTKKRLQMALIQLLKKKPLTKIQIKEIAEVADVSRATFYHHFETKEQLLFSLVDDLFTRVNRIVFEEVSDSNEVNILSLFMAFYKQLYVHKETLQWMAQVEDQNQIISLLRSHLDMITQELDKYVPPPEFVHAYRAYASNFVSGGSYMVVKMWLDNGLREAPETMAALTFIMIHRGFSSVDGTKNLSEDVPLQRAFELLQAAK